MRTVHFRDSFFLLRSSLERCSKELVDTAIQKTQCREYPHAIGRHGTKINIDENKSCECCRKMAFLPDSCPEALQFASLALGSVQHVDVLQKKMLFPYKILDLPLDTLRQMDLPSLDFYQDELNEGKIVTAADHEKVTQDCRSMGIRSAYEMMILYLFIDCMSLSSLLHFASRFLADQFGGQNILEYFSVSRFAYDLIIDSACKQIGTEGIEYISSIAQYASWSDGVLGGFNSNSFYGRMLRTNNILIPGFDSSKLQDCILPIDRVSHYGTLSLRCTLRRYVT